MHLGLWLIIYLKKVFIEKEKKKKYFNSFWGNMKNFLSFYLYFLNDIPPLKILIYKQISPYEVMIVYVYYK